MEHQVYQQFLDLERDHWWFRGRRTVYLGLLDTVLQPTKRGRLLDLGCGMGGFLSSLQDMGFDVFGADMDFESLQQCIDRGFTQCAQMDSYELPFADHSFDVVTMFDAIEHVEDDYRAMGEVARVLKPGGQVIISVPAYQFLYANNDRVAQHYRRYNRNMVNELFQRAGLKVARNTHANVFLFPLILPIVLTIKLFEAVFDRKHESLHSNLSFPMPKFMNQVLHRIFAAELWVTRKHNWPFGHSIVAIAQRES